MADGTISKIQLPDNTIYDVVDNTSGYMTGMTILSYGNSTWQNFIDAYSDNKVVYCRASSSANPASGSQTRLAFMAYVNNATTPTEVEFQYYRSVSTHTASQQGDQVYVYKLNKTNGWSVTVREASVKVVAGTGLGGTYSNGTMTLTGPTKVSDLINDSGFLTSYTETDPTVPSWAKASSKPSYNFSEIGSTPTTLSGYGITDASISSGVITLGSNTITPLTSSSTLSAAKLSGAIPSAVTATTQSASDNSTKIATTAYVTTAIANLPEPMLFKGSVGIGGTITSLPTAAAANEGFTYKVITALSTPVTAKVGDTVISNGSEWVVIPSGDEPSGTVTSVGLSNATNGGLTISGSPITSSGSITVGHSNVLTSAQTTQAIYPIKIDKNGHISAYGSAVTPLTASSTLDATKLSGTIPSNCYTDTNTTYALSNALSSHKFTSTLTAGGSGSGTSTATMEFVAGTGITLTDDTTNKKITIASSVTNTDEKLKVTNDAVDNTEYYPIFGSSSTSAETKKIDSSGFKFTTYNGTTSVTGSSILYLGNNTASGTAGNKIGYIKLYGSTRYSYTITGATLHPLADRTLTLPDKSGTIALTSDIPTIPSNNVTGSGSTDYLAKWSGTNTLSRTSLYINTFYNSSSDLYGTIKLYVGSAGQIDWRGQLVFHDGSSSKTITITPPSLTASRTLTLPDKTGTVALTSDIPDIGLITNAEIDTIISA